jgi:hypothetical protein
LDFFHYLLVHKLILSANSFLGQFIEECSDGEEVDELETCYERKSQKETQQASESGENAEPILIHIFPVMRRD